MKKSLILVLLFLNLILHAQSAISNNFSERFSQIYDSLKNTSNLGNLDQKQKLFLKKKLLSYCNAELKSVSIKLDKIAPVSDRQKLKSSKKLWKKYFDAEIILAKQIYTQDKLNYFSDIYIFNRQIHLIHLRILDLYEFISFYSR